MLKPDSLLRFFAAIVIALLGGAAHAAIFDQPITLDTPSGQIAGSLMMPSATRAVPVALIIAGSGPTDRNGNTQGLPGANNSLLMLAQALGDAGFAVVRYDKRGVGASLAAAKSESELRFDSYVDDATAWVAQLRHDARFSSVILIGHSEGALIGMIAAQKAGANGFVSISGAGRRASDVIRTQFAGKLPPELAAQNETILNALERGQTAITVPKEFAGFYRPSIQPYLASWFRYAPAERIGALEVPVLIVQGTTDVQVAVSDAEALKKALPKAQLLVVPGMNHVLKMVEGGLAEQQPSYFDPTLPLAPGLTRPLVAFMRGIPVR
jgi:pimeloyl-ACP methyl ester carboxylesterase